MRSVSFSGDGSRIVSGSDDKTVRVWDAVSGECVLGPLEGHTNWVTRCRLVWTGRASCRGRTTRPCVCGTRCLGRRVGSAGGAHSWCEFGVV